MSDSLALQSELLDLTCWLREWSFQASTSATLGVGFDIEEVSRWEKPLRLDILFTPSERAHCEAKASPARHYAGLWCAKEAAFKALSQEVTVNLREMEVVHNPSGAPRIRFLTPVPEGVSRRLTISITHTATLAAALALYASHG
ncbi:4'-phosphopantetheinyl transferase superfamily protein [Deinococcus sp. NW-56]|uniref:holo-ACP synthase n=1 Tax=Deinococcus sp. NW-56 TaxID=2080419 RepID=UPI000CF3753D